LTLYTLTRETFRGSSLKNGPPAIFSVLYTGGCLGYIAALRNEIGAGAVFLLLITIWCTDTTAYFYGTYRGKRLLCPQISPKKTWEGAGAATLVAAGLAFLSGPMLVGIGPGQALSFGFVISITGQMGDLVESSLKRQAGVKDTGRLLPGHGGLLDRFDSLLFAAPMAYYLLHIWM
ncbi:MAG: phosphatidate cytidylyltransferase, partial [Limnochordia bacterium]